MDELSSIKLWDASDRPREKLVEKGAANLSNAELLAILLGSGSKSESAVMLAQKVLNSVGDDLSTLGKSEIADLTVHKGIGPAKAVTLVASFELARRRLLSQNSKVKISSSSAVYDAIGPLLADLPHEEFWVLYLNRANVITRKERVSSGGVTGTVVDVRIILKKAINELSSGIILVHNHPSGNLQPSLADKKITEKLKVAADLLEIKLLDHLIIAGNSYYSFADETAL